MVVKSTLTTENGHIFQGCHYLLDVKFKDFSMTFQDLFK